ncbi:hypothetical protein BVRB_024160 [Beta vulgaris subsp. vulgaris]|uniref:Uncharacterized protein n=1 Tax=Beta vulgaris subsp. vulgaris TaxID=3555 RepID=A0A0J8AZF9_BETVV|nr:hypothetical protein BVRB_024160 [Beta vulgaris subsp. vulgaris]
MFFDTLSSPSTCSQHLIDHGLYSPSCLLLPDHIDVAESSKHSLTYVQNAERYFSLSSASVDLATKRLITFSCFLFSFHGISVPGPKNKAQPLVRHIIMDALKLSLDLYKRIMHLLDNAVRLRASTSQLWSQDPADEDLLSLGRTMRSMESSWRNVKFSRTTPICC